MSSWIPFCIKRARSTEHGIDFTTRWDKGSSTLVVCVSLSNGRVGLTVLGIRSITSSTDSRLWEIWR